MQYGLSGLTSVAITPTEFLDLNAKVGSWKAPPHMVQEGCPFTPAGCADPAQFDPWAPATCVVARRRGNPAPRPTGDRRRDRGRRTRSGLVFTGGIDIPIIDWRHYLEDQLNMHNSHQSFASRQRMLNHDGNAGNQSSGSPTPGPRPCSTRRPRRSR